MAAHWVNRKLFATENNSTTSTCEAEKANNSDSEYQLFLSTSSSENIDDPDEITSQNMS